MRLLSCLILFVGATSPLWAQEDSGEPWAGGDSGMKVEADAVWPHPISGYAYPVRIQIENDGQARDIECSVSNMGDYVGGSTWDVVRRVRVGEHEKVRFTLLVPHSDLPYTNLRIAFVGNDKDLLQRTIGGGRYYSGGDAAEFLLVDHRKTFTPAETEASFPSASYRYGYGKGKGACVMLPPERLTDDWRAYVGSPGLFVLAADWKSMTPGVRAAILRAVKAGQRLVIYETGTPSPKELTQLLFDGQAPAWADVEDNASEVIAATEVRLGLGRIYGVEGKVIGRNNLPLAFDLGKPDSLATSMVKEALYLKIPGVGEPPYTAFFWIVLIFAVILGPLNLFLVQRVKRRILFVITTPVVAFVAVATLLAFSALHEGFDIKGSVRSVTLLNSEDKEAVVASATALYAGASTGTWNYDAETLEMNAGSSPTSPDDAYYGRGRRSRRSSGGRTINIDVSQGQAIGGGWVPPRGLTKLVSLQVVANRSRLALERGEGGAVVLHNGLGADIVEGVVRVGQEWYAVPAIRDGGSGQARPDKMTKPAWMSASSADLFPARSGEFLVRTKRNPAIDFGGKTFEEINSVHIVAGTVTESK